MAIAVMAAMEEELVFLRQQLVFEQVYKKGPLVLQKGFYKEIPLFVVQSGIGKANAAMAAAALLERNRPGALVQVGTAGGLGENLLVGGLVVGTEALYSDIDATCFGYQPGQVPQMPPRYLADPKLLKVARAAAQKANLAHGVCFGPILTSDSFMHSPERVAAVKGAFPGAKASDMEGAAAAQVAFAYGVPYLNIRAVSDLAGQNAAQSFRANLSLAAQNAAAFFLQWLKAANTKTFQ
ncbi:MAG: 5'-methylthioadenosine/adenosylhomocysteine nucleosidase [Oscillospiraceae bacterium]